MKTLKKHGFEIFLMVVVLVLGLLVILLVAQNRRLQEQLAQLTRRPTPATLKPGDEVAAVELLQTSGQERTLSYAPGERLKLLLVFNTTCPSCQNNLANWEQIVLAADPQRVEITGISLHDLSRTRDFAAGRELSFPVTVPLDADFVERYKVDAVPQTILVAGDGRVREVWLGVLDEAQVAKIRRLVS